MTGLSSLYRIPLAGAVAVGLLATAATAPIVSGPAVAAEIKLAHFMSPRHPMDRFLMRPWSKEIAKATGNALTVRIYPGGALGKGPVALMKSRAAQVAALEKRGVPAKKILAAMGVK